MKERISSAQFSVGDEATDLYCEASAHNAGMCLTPLSDVILREPKRLKDPVKFHGDIRYPVSQAAMKFHGVLQLLRLSQNDRLKEGLAGTAATWCETTGQVSLPPTLQTSRLTSHLSLLALLLLLVAPLSTSAAIKAEIPPLRPPREELPANIDRYDPLPWFIVAVAAGLLGAALAWPRTPKRKVVELPADIAFRQIQTLSNPAPAEVSQIFRRYLIAALRLPGQGVTTEEIHDALADEQPLATEVTAFLSECDAAKFSPAPPPPANPADTARALITAIERRLRATQTLHAVQSARLPVNP